MKRKDDFRAIESEKRKMVKKMNGNGNVHGEGKKKAAVLFTEMILILNIWKLGAEGKEADISSFFAHSGDTRLPQTIVNHVVTDFLQDPLPEGKDTKKVIVLGYDGFREDGLEIILDDPQSSVRMAAEQGGLYHTYAGGEGEQRQETTTGPGWASILTGGWSGSTGIDSCADTKRGSIKTFLMDAAQKGYPSVFAASWAEHFTVTYKQDIEYASRRQLPLRYIQTMGDEETYETILQLVTKRRGQEKSEMQDPDVIFFTLEITDRAGHQTGFENQNPSYRDACIIADACGRNIIWEIKHRDTYEREEWLILITTDHGGIGTSHGGQTEEERNTWLASSRKIEGWEFEQRAVTEY